MSKFTDFLLSLIDRGVSELHQGVVAKVDAFDGEEMTADVIPLLQTKNIDGDITDYGKLQKIPVAFLYSGDYYIRPYYKKDDLVWISFSSFDYSNAIEGKNAPIDDIKYSLSYACVMHGVKKTGSTAPTPFSKSGLLIGYKDSYIHIDENDVKMKISGEYTIENDSGKIEIDSAGNIDLNGSADNAVSYADMKSAFDQLKAELTTHVHTGNQGSPTSAPTVPFTADMSGAKVDNVRLP